MLMDGDVPISHASCGQCGWLGLIIDTSSGCCGEETCPECSTEIWEWLTNEEARKEIDNNEDQPLERERLYELCKINPKTDLG